MQFDPEKLSLDENSRLIGRLAVPRPIAWVSTVGENGVTNLAPFSAYNFVGNKPPMVCISVGWRHGQKKDTLRNMEFTGDFVVNLVDEGLAKAMALTVPAYGPEVSEFGMAGVTALPGAAVRAPRVAESPAAMECRLVRSLEIGSPEDYYTLVIGEVVLFHVRDDVYGPDGIDLSQLGAIGQLYKDTYCRTDSTFEAKRPTSTKPQINTD